MSDIAKDILKLVSAEYDEHETCNYDIECILTSDTLETSITAVTNKIYERGYNTGYVTGRRVVGGGLDDDKHLRQIADKLVERAESIYTLITPPNKENKQ